MDQRHHEMNSVSCNSNPRIHDVVSNKRQHRQEVREREWSKLGNISRGLILLVDADVNGQPPSQCEAMLMTTVSVLTWFSGGSRLGARRGDRASRG